MLPYFRIYNKHQEHNEIICILKKYWQIYSFSFVFKVGNVNKVYEEVEEKEYIKRRQDRMESDWIVDDGKHFNL